MKRSDLHREWARVLDMCEGTDVRTVDCVRSTGMSMQMGEFYPECEPPNFKDEPSEYSFALAIVKGRPVFVGDVLYDAGGYAPFGIHELTVTEPATPVVIIGNTQHDLISVRKGDVEYWADVKKLSWNPHTPIQKQRAPFSFEEAMRVLETDGIRRLMSLETVVNGGTWVFTEVKTEAPHGITEIVLRKRIGI